LKYESDAPYRVLTQVYPWANGEAEGFIDVSARLQAAMLQNPHLKVLVAAGYYDLATPFASVDYTIGHLDLARQISDRITQAYFPSGHMIYHHGPSRQKLREAVGKLIDSAVPATQP
jgi:carboxypeptidase C (cathepsin A)